MKFSELIRETLAAWVKMQVACESRASDREISEAKDDFQGLQFRLKAALRSHNFILHEGILYLVDDRGEVVTYPCKPSETTDVP